MGHLNDMYGADDMSAVGAAVEARKRERGKLYKENTEMLTQQEQRDMADEAAKRREWSEAKSVAFGMGGPELTVGPNPNSRGQADKDREPFVSLSTSTRTTGVVEDACKAFAKNEISGDEFERRVRPLVTAGVPRIMPETLSPSARYCTCVHCDQARERRKLVPDSLDPRELVPDSLDPRPLANWNGEPVKLWSAPGKTEEILSAARPGIGGAPTRATTLPTDAAGRKEYPVASGFMDYFPDAIAAVSNLSKKGNDQHNPGQPLHWARGKSGDESDTMMRHFLQRGTLDTDGIRHTVKMAWRAMAILQKEIEGEK